MSEENTEKKKGFLKSVFGDNDYDADITKVIGFGIVCAGLVGFFLGKNNFEWVIGFGAGLIATGKFSNNG